MKPAIHAIAVGAKGPRHVADPACWCHPKACLRTLGDLTLIWLHSAPTPPEQKAKP